MNQEQLNIVADTYNEAKKDLLENGELRCKDAREQTVSTFLSLFSCYLFVYRDLFPERYETAKNVLQNITDLVTLGVDIENCSAKEGEFSAEEQHLVYLGE